MRDLCRARQAAMEGLRRARSQVLSFLLRHGRIYSGGGHWTRNHRLWLSAQRFDHPAQQIAFEELVQATEEAKARRDRLAKQMQELAPSWSLAQVVTAIQALRGVALIAAITLVAEILRFSSLRQSSPTHGLSRSDAERAIFWSKDIARRHHQGRKHKSQTGAGRGSLDLSSAGADRGPDPQAQREPAAADQGHCLEGADSRRTRGYALGIAGSSEKAKPANVVNVAIARELAAFVWAIATNEHVRLA
jgi:transposase